MRKTQSLKRKRAGQTKLRLFSQALLPLLKFGFDFKTWTSKKSYPFFGVRGREDGQQCAPSLQNAKTNKKDFNKNSQSVKQELQQADFLAEIGSDTPFDEVKREIG